MDFWSDFDGDDHVFYLQIHDAFTGFKYATLIIIFYAILKKLLSRAFWRCIFALESNQWLVSTSVQLLLLDP